MNYVQQNGIRGLLGKVSGTCVWMLITIVPLAMTAVAQSNSPRPGTWSTNNTVKTVTEANGIVYIGGSFTRVGPYNGSFAVVDTATGNQTETFPPVNDAVYACVPDGSGGWYIGGAFTEVGGLARSGLAHILSNRTVDASFNPGLDNGSNPVVEVRALALSEGILYLGGGFEGVESKPRGHLAALDLSTGLATEWHPDSNGRVTKIVVVGEVVYVGGDFWQVGGQTRAHLAALDRSSGMATAFNPQPDGGFIKDFAVLGDAVFVCGGFWRMGGQLREWVAALDPASGDPTAWDPEFDFLCNAIEASGNTVYIGGQSTSSSPMLAIDATTGEVLASLPEPGFDLVTRLAISGSRLYASGDESASDSYHCAIEISTGQLAEWSPAISSPADILFASPDRVVLGGSFSVIGGAERRCIAALDASTGRATSWDANLVRSGGEDVSTIAVSDNVVYLGGWFNNVGGQARMNLAAVSAGTGDLTLWNPDPVLDSGSQGWVSEILVSGDIVYVAGNFNRIGGQDRGYLAAIDRTTGRATAWNPDADTAVEAMALSGNILYVGGHFLHIGGRRRSFIAALDTVSGEALEWNPNADLYVESLAVSGNAIFAGGRFLNVGNSPMRFLAKLDTASGEAMSWDARANNVVTGLAIAGDGLLACGSFDAMGGEYRAKVASLDLETGAVSAWSPDLRLDGSLYPHVAGVAASGDTAYVCGSFRATGAGGPANIAFFDHPTDPTGFGCMSGGKSLLERMYGDFIVVAASLVILLAFGAVQKRL